MGYPFCQNVNSLPELKGQRRALLVYLVEPFYLPKEDLKFSSHQNFGQSKLIAAMIGKFGYSVDVADYRDNLGWLKGSYDLVITHRIELRNSLELINKARLKIYLASGTQHRVHNENLRARLEELKARRGCEMKALVWDDEDLSCLASFEAIICFGNAHTERTWSENCELPVHGFNNYGFESIEFAEKDFDRCKSGFLFFGSKQQIGKGLDLLLEVFPKHPELDLFVCGNYESEKDFCRCYKEELFHSPNIHPMGFVPVNSPLFRHLVGSTAFVTLPSCSEGQPGSVVQCMHAGLLPILTPECGIDTEDFGITLASHSLEDIEKTIVSAAQQPVEWYLERTRRVRETALAKYSVDAFVHRWENILNDLHIDNGIELPKTYGAVGFNEFKKIH
jgi:hypothetical protein